MKFSAWIHFTYLVLNDSVLFILLLLLFMLVLVLLLLLLLRFVFLYCHYQSFRQLVRSCQQLQFTIDVLLAAQRLQKVVCHLCWQILQLHNMPNISGRWCCGQRRWSRRQRSIGNGINIIFKFCISRLQNS